LAVVPFSAAKAPLTPNGVNDATRDPEIIRAWWGRWPFADPAAAVPERMVVVDVDRRGGQNGFRAFARLAGCDPLDVETPIATTPSGGLHLYFSAAKPYANKVRIDGTSIDVRARGGCAILPAHNGRRWLKKLSKTPMAPAPDWLDCAARQARAAHLFRCPAQAAPSSAAGGIFARALLVRACRLILSAPQGAQEETRHRQCFSIGALIGAGAVDYDVAYQALIAAANAMPAYGRPWRDLEQKVVKSLERGMGRGA
jgi:hypothetical protein